MTQPVAGNGTGSPGAMIEVDRLSRYYGPVAALRDVSFRANRGEIVGFLGPNGAGKTTTMRILTGFMPPSGGTAWVAGFDVVEQSMDARRAIGYLPENTPLYTEMTVRGYLSFMARLRRVADRDAAVERVMGRVGIANRADDLISQLSKGLRQRVGIAQALVHDPKVVILDEPTIGLDPNQIREVQGLIGELRGDHTVILSTHILSEAEEVCDRILIIREGEIVADDALERLSEQAQRGGTTVRVVVAPEGATADVEAALAGVDGVQRVTAHGDGAYSVEVADPRAAGPSLAAAVVDGGWPLLELTPIHLTLRDIYLQATVRQVDAEALAGAAGSPDDDDDEYDLDADGDDDYDLDVDDDTDVIDDDEYDLDDDAEHDDDRAPVRGHDEETDTDDEGKEASS